MRIPLICMVCLTSILCGFSPSQMASGQAQKKNDENNLEKRLTNSIGMEFALVPKGTIWIGGGTDKVRGEVEMYHDFYLGVYLVTQEEWEKVMGKNPSGFSRVGEYKDKVTTIADADLKRFPVERVSWHDCQEFVRRLNKLPKRSADLAGWDYRLPTGLEWESACRGGGGQKREDYSFDYYLDRPMNNLPTDKANVYESGLKRPCKVGSYPPNRLGLYDMQGNVMVWCEERGNSERGFAGGRLIRGGGWGASAKQCTASSSNLIGGETDRKATVGVRVALVPSDYK